MCQTDATAIATTINGIMLLNNWLLMLRVFNALGYNVNELTDILRPDCSRITGSTTGNTSANATAPSALPNAALLSFNDLIAPVITSGTWTDALHDDGPIGLLSKRMRLSAPSLNSAVSIQITGSVVLPATSSYSFVAPPLSNPPMTRMEGIKVVNELKDELDACVPPFAPTAAWKAEFEKAVHVYNDFFDASVRSIAWRGVFTRCVYLANKKRSEVSQQVHDDFRNLLTKCDADCDYDDIMKMVCTTYNISGDSSAADASSGFKKLFNIKKNDSILAILNDFLNWYLKNHKEVTKGAVPENEVRNYLMNVAYNHSSVYHYFLSLQANDIFVTSRKRVVPKRATGQKYDIHDLVDILIHCVKTVTPPGQTLYAYRDHIAHYPFRQGTSFN